eukprot:scaffold527842_cov18-Prasinocladus_malaysianus.AAC.1
MGPYGSNTNHVRKLLTYPSRALLEVFSVRTMLVPVTYACALNVRTSGLSHECCVGIYWTTLDEVHPDLQPDTGGANVDCRRNAEQAGSYRLVVNDWIAQKLSSRLVELLLMYAAKLILDCGRLEPPASGHV